MPTLLSTAVDGFATAVEIDTRVRSLLSDKAFRDRHGEDYPNPMSYTKFLTGGRHAYPVLRRYIHGDLKLENILADVKSSVSEPLIVDLASVRVGVPDFDFARLEASIFAHVFANPRRQPNGGAAALQEAWKLQEAVEDENSTYNAEPLALLRSIRRTRLDVISAAGATDPSVAANPNGEQTAHRVCLYLSYLDLAVKAANRSQSPSPEFLSLYAAAAHHLRALQTE